MKRAHACIVLAGICLALLPAHDAAANLVVNGDFEAGNTGFDTTYTFVAAGTIGAAGTYGIDANPRNRHPNWFSFGDHTSGSGNMMIVNGSSTTGPAGFVWRSQGDFAITPNTNYFFEAFVANAHPSNGAVLTFEVFNSATNSWDTLGNADLRSVPAGQWRGISFTWSSGSNTSTRLRLLNAQPAGGGNDFVIDDINFDGTSSLPGADLAIEKGVNPATVSAGGGVAYTLLVSNNGPAAADGAIVTDPGAPELDCTGLSCTASGGATCPAAPTPTQLAAGLAIPTLPVGGSVSFVLNCTLEAIP